MRVSERDQQPSAPDPWAEFGIDKCVAERGTEMRFDPFAQEWKRYEVLVKMEPKEFAHGSVRRCFRAKVVPMSAAAASDIDALRLPIGLVPGLAAEQADALAETVRASVPGDGAVTVEDLLLGIEREGDDGAICAALAGAAGGAEGTASKAWLSDLQARRATLHLEARWARPDCNRVAKCYLDDALKDDAVRAATEEDVVCQAVAKAWAEAYNQSDIVEAAIAPSKDGRSDALRHPPKQLEFVALTLLELPSRPVDGSAGPRIYALEAVIEGEYRKFNNNAGMLVEDVHRQTPQALSHFAWERSGGRVMLADVQGVGELLTDPVIHTASGTGFGSTNLGVRGMSLFFASHLHTPLLELLGLKPFGLSPVEVRRLPALIREFQQHDWDKTEAGKAGEPAPAVKFLAGGGQEVSLEAAAAAAAGPIPLGFVPSEADEAAHADAVRRAAASASSFSAAGAESRPEGVAPAMRRSPSKGPSLASGLGAATAGSRAGPAQGSTPTAGSAIQSPTASGAGSTVRSMRRVCSRSGRELARGALAPAQHLMRTHHAATIARTDAAGSGIVSVPMLPTPVHEEEAAEEDDVSAAATAPTASGPSGERGGTAVSSASGTSGVSASKSESLKLLQAALPQSPSARPSVVPGVEVAELALGPGLAAGALASAPDSPYLSAASGGIVFSEPDLGEGTSFEAVPSASHQAAGDGASPAQSGSESATGAAASVALARSNAESLRLVFGATHFDLALCHANGRLMHFPETDASAVGFHLATAAEHFPPAALAAAKVCLGEEAVPFPEGCLAPSKILAFRWFHRAATMGSRAAMIRVARMLLEGIPAPLEADPASALRTWTGLPPFEAADSAASRAVAVQWARAGVAADAALALQWLEAAIKTDPDADATRTMLSDPAWRLQAEAAALAGTGGPGLEPDTVRAATLYTLAAEGAMAVGKFKASSKYSAAAAALED